MHHIVYVTTDTATGRYYIGKHSTDNIDDGYLGSGGWVRAWIKEGKALYRQVVAQFSTENDALSYERSLILGAKCDPLCRNKNPGATGFRLGSRTSSESLSKGQARYRGSLSPEEYRLKHGAGWRGKKRPEHSMRMSGEGNPFHGKEHTDAAKEKMRTSRSSDERAESARGNTNVRGRSWYTDGVRNFMLMPDDPRISDLRPGKITRKRARRDGE